MEGAALSKTLVDSLCLGNPEVWASLFTHPSLDLDHSYARFCESGRAWLRTALLSLLLPRRSPRVADFLVSDDVLHALFELHFPQPSRVITHEVAQHYSTAATDLVCAFLGALSEVAPRRWTYLVIVNVVRWMYTRPELPLLGESALSILEGGISPRTQLNRIFEKAGLGSAEAALRHTPNNRMEILAPDVYVQRAVSLARKAAGEATVAQEHMDIPVSTHDGRYVLASVGCSRSAGAARLAVEIEAVHRLRRSLVLHSLVGVNESTMFGNPDLFARAALIQAEMERRGFARFELESVPGVGGIQMVALCGVRADGTRAIMHFESSDLIEEARELCIVNSLMGQPRPFTVVESPSYVPPTSPAYSPVSPTYARGQVSPAYSPTTNSPVYAPRSPQL